MHQVIKNTEWYNQNTIENIANEHRFESLPK